MLFLNLQLVPFLPHSLFSFVQKASVGCEEAGLTPDGLKVLWTKVCSLIWVTPKAKYMYGTFEKGFPPPKPKRVVKSASRANDAPLVMPDIVSLSPFFSV